MGGNENDKTVKEKDKEKEAKTPPTAPTQEHSSTTTGAVNPDWNIPLYCRMDFWHLSPQAHPYMWGVQELLPPTNSRLRPDRRYLENGEFEMANAKKIRLEQRQRQAREMQERGWKPRWFAKDKGSEMYRYVRGYWEAKERGNWDQCPDIFGQIPSDQLLD